MSESPDFWEGFDVALNLLNIEVDKILTACYNEVRTKDSLLDVKVSIQTLQRMMPNGDTEDMHQPL